MKLDTWLKKVASYNQELNNQLKTNKDAKALYYGFEVFDGKVFNFPKLLIVGINPGKGEASDNKKVVEVTDEISYLDVFHENYKEVYKNSYHLAEKTLKAFRDMEWSEKTIESFLQTEVVKTNLYHIATENASGINKCINSFTNSSSKAYRDANRAFLFELIEIMQPELVLFEGKMAYDGFIRWRLDYHDTWRENDEYGYHFDEYLKTHFIGYKRTMTTKNRAKYVAKLKALTHGFTLK